MNDEAAFVRSVCESPFDDTVRLAFADYLDENAGDVPCGRCGGESLPFDASVRLRMEGLAPCPDCRGSGAVSNGYADRAEFVRVQCRLEAIHNRDSRKDGGPPLTEYNALRRRERELLDTFGRAWAGHDFHYVNPVEGVWVGERAAVATYRRGFVESVALPLAAAGRARDWRNGRPVTDTDCRALATSAPAPAAPPASPRPCSPPTRF
jgi:uncharacterized protein (TIGR02996 family)